MPYTPDSVLRLHPAFVRMGIEPRSASEAFSSPEKVLIVPQGAPLCSRGTRLSGTWETAHACDQNHMEIEDYRRGALDA